MRREIRRSNAEKTWRNTTVDEAGRKEQLTTTQHKPVSKTLTHEHSREAKQYASTKVNVTSRHLTSRKVQHPQPNVNTCQSTSSHRATAEGLQDQQSRASTTCELLYYKRRNLFIITWMSEGTHHHRPPIANQSFVLSESARWAIARLSEPPRIELDSVRRNIETQYPKSEIESPNVIVKREFPFNNIDESLLVTEPTDSTDEVRRVDKQLRSRISRTPSNVSLQWEFSLTSYESDTFDSEEVYRHLRGEMSVARIPTEYTLPNIATNADLDVPRQIPPARAANRGYGTNTTNIEARRNGPYRDIGLVAWNAYGNAHGIALLTWASTASGKHQPERPPAEK